MFHYFVLFMYLLYIYIFIKFYFLYIILELYPTFLFKKYIVSLFIYFYFGMNLSHRCSLLLIESFLHCGSSGPSGWDDPGEGGRGQGREHTGARGGLRDQLPLGELLPRVWHAGAARPGECPAATPRRGREITSQNAQTYDSTYPETPQIDIYKVRVRDTRVLACCR